MLTAGPVHSSESQYASPSQIPCRSIEHVAETNSRFSIFQDGERFQDGGVRHLGFAKVENFNRWTCSKGQYASTCQISCRSRGPLRRFIFQDGGRPQSWICFTCIRTTNEEYLFVFVTVQNLVGIGAVGFDNMSVLMFCEFGLKMPTCPNGTSRILPQNQYFQLWNIMDGKSLPKGNMYQ